MATCSYWYVCTCSCSVTIIQTRKCQWLLSSFRSLPGEILLRHDPNALHTALSVLSHPLLYDRFDFFMLRSKLIYLLTSSTAVDDKQEVNYVSKGKWLTSNFFRILCTRNYLDRLIYLRTHRVAFLRHCVRIHIVGAFLQATSRVPRWWIGERPPDMAASCDIYK